MTMRSLLFSFILTLTLPAMALETDNYLAWDKTLSDSSAHINRFLSDSIKSALTQIPNHRMKSCDEMTVLIGKEFESRLVHDNPVENWLFTILTDKEMFPSDLHYVEDSIYREPYRFYIPWFGLAPNIQVNGYYFGTDKLSHFASTGMIYFRIFRDQIRKNKSSLAALKRAIDWGIRDEKTVHGFWASGVFSYADLEANYQGLLFFQRFCSTENSFLQRSNDGNWSLVNPPEIKEFINGAWDESYLLSYRKPLNWKKVAAIIKAKYCEKFQTTRVQKRFSYYKETSRLSKSQEYLTGIKSLPPAQSFKDLCSEDGINEGTVSN